MEGLFYEKVHALECEFAEKFKPLFDKVRKTKKISDIVSIGPCMCVWCLITVVVVFFVCTSDRGRRILAEEIL